MRNNFSEFLLAPAGFERHGQAVRIPIRLPWYRALPLSVFELGRLSINNVEVAPTNIRLIVNGNSHPVGSLGDLVNEWWYVLDDAILEALLPTATPGSQRADNALNVELTLKLYPPYIPGLAWITQSQREYRTA